MGHVEVARDGHTILLRAVGLGNMRISFTMRDFVETAVAEGYTCFLVDLSHCRGMDSTFMGTLVHMNQTVHAQKGHLRLINVAPSNRALLDQLGVTQIVPVKESVPLQPIEFEMLPPDTDEAKRLENIRLAHQHLVRIDERNHERFGAFLAALEREMESADNDRENDEPPADGAAPSGGDSPIQW